MEFLNRIELRGIVGNVRVQEAGGAKVARLSVATDYAYRDREGGAVIETTWFNVTAFEGSGMPDFATLKRGAAVEVSGRVRVHRYTENSGIDRVAWEVYAKTLTVLDTQEHLTLANI